MKPYKQIITMKKTATKKTMAAKPMAKKTMNKSMAMKKGKC
jgi:hypothetical protein